MDLDYLLYWYAAHRWYGGALVFILGLCVGSFLNVCIYRIPNKLSIRTPPSHCPDCKARLSALDMIPVASWLFLGGKCRHCGKRISPRYLFVELLTGLLFLLCWWKLPGWRLLTPALLLTSVLVASAFIDAEQSIIPNGIVLFGAVAGAACVIITGRPSWQDAIFGGLAGAVPLMAIDVISRLILRKDGMGGGDVKLMAMAGLFLGWRAALLALVLAVVAGGAAGAGLLVARKLKRGDYFPFGPFLAAGVFASLLFYGNIMALYAAFNNFIVNLIIG
jgi:leader peptidase (prepilin peptidase) / N-methyltransferase